MWGHTHNILYLVRSGEFASFVPHFSLLSSPQSSPPLAIDRDGRHCHCTVLQTPLSHLPFPSSHAFMPTSRTVLHGFFFVAKLHPVLQAVKGGGNQAPVPVLGPAPPGAGTDATPCWDGGHKIGNDGDKWCNQHPPMLEMAAASVGKSRRTAFRATVGKCSRSD